MSLIYDWNRVDAPAPPSRVMMLADETLRDGLQSASVRCPTIDEKIEILHLTDAIGVDAVDIGLPGAGPHVVADVERLAREAVTSGLRADTYCAARTVRADILPIVEISQRVGRPLGVAAFIGSSHIRQFVEGWTVDFLQKSTEEAIAFAVREGLPVMYVTEDTTRAHRRRRLRAPRGGGVWRRRRA
jgi:2-isopropylmalate synthase